MSLETAARRRRILVVEDDDDIRCSIGELFRADGFDVVERSNGLEAIRSLREERAPDLIIFDLCMPVMDGWQLRVEQKGDPELARIPVVAISADQSPRAAAIDADYFIKKPFSAEALRRAVDHVLTHVERERAGTAELQAERLASLGLLAAGVAHEINNPLAYVIANLDYVAGQVRRLERELPVGRLGELGRALEESRDGAERIRRIVRDLGIFSRADEEHRQRIDLRRILDLCLNITGNQIRHRGQVITEFGPVPPVAGDEARLGQVFINLLVNAAQALDEERAGQNEVRIRTGVDDNGWAVVEVCDTGRGIEPGDLQRIFDPFFTTKPIGVGTGLGLSICHGIVAALGGRIEVESEVGRGSRFRVLLPAIEEVVEEEIEEVGSAPTAAARARVLVIDDEPMICTAVRRELADDNEVVTASSALDALDKLTRGDRFDVILCDLMMPGVSGMDLYDRVAALSPGQAGKFVFFTGGAFTPRARAFLERVDNARIEKPFEGRTLRALIRERMRS